MKVLQIHIGFAIRALEAMVTNLSNEFAGITLNAIITNNIPVGDGVMMAPDVIIFSSNHITTSTKTPKYLQGATEPVRTIIEDDVWIGQRVIMTL